jgi:hypothetical protein
MQPEVFSSEDEDDEDDEDEGDQSEDGSLTSPDSVSSPNDEDDAINEAFLAEAKQRPRKFTMPAVRKGPVRLLCPCFAAALPLICGCSAAALYQYQYTHTAHSILIPRNQSHGCGKQHGNKPNS